MPHDTRRSLVRVLSRRTQPYTSRTDPTGVAGPLKLSSLEPGYPSDRALEAIRQSSGTTSFAHSRIVGGSPDEPFARRLSGGDSAASEKRSRRPRQVRHSQGPHSSWAKCAIHTGRCCGERALGWSRTPTPFAAVLQGGERPFAVVRRSPWRIQIDPFGAVACSPSFV
jgi:hypothetical protein